MSTQIHLINAHSIISGKDIVYAIREERGHWTVYQCATRRQAIDGGGLALRSFLGLDEAEVYVEHR